MFQDLSESHWHLLGLLSATPMKVLNLCFVLGWGCQATESNFSAFFYQEGFYMQLSSSDKWINLIDYQFFEVKYWIKNLNNSIQGCGQCII